MTDWQKAELDIRSRLGLDGTIASGNRWYDIGDSVDNNHFTKSVFPLMVESKATQHQSYSINRKYVQEYWEKASMTGRRFLLHTQFQDKKDTPTSVESIQRDWVTLTLDDFQELFDLAQRGFQKEPDPLPERTEEEDMAIRMIPLLFQHIQDTETRAKYYSWWETIEKYLPTTEVQS